MHFIVETLKVWCIQVLNWPRTLKIIFGAFVCFQISIFFVLKLPVATLPSVLYKDPLVRFALLQGATEFDATTEQALLFDSAPLFIPTQWNASQATIAETYGIAANSFEDFEPEIILTSQITSNAVFKSKTQAAQNPTDLLNSQFQNTFAAYGEQYQEVLPLRTTPLTILFRTMDSEWTELPINDSKFTSEGLQSPIRFYLRVLEPGITAGPVVLVEPLELSEFSDNLRTFLMKPEMIAQLPVGHIECVVYPSL